MENNEIVCDSSKNNVSAENDKFPKWVVVLLILFFSGFFMIPVIGIVAAISVPILMTSTQSIKSKSIFKKVYSQFNQALLLEHALSDKYYNSSDEVLKKALLKHLGVSKVRDDKIILTDGTELKVSKFSDKCNQAPINSKYTEDSACAKIIIDTDGFGNGVDKAAKSYKVINDQFVLLLYADKVEPITGSIEDKILNMKEEK